ncbi:MAG: hypothetical protein GY845_35380 [Planctomycetes bacterium]|nr:hypothetical protein [Planctomycetota bacterium]
MARSNVTMCNQWRFMERALETGSHEYAYYVRLTMPERQELRRRLAMTMRWHEAELLSTKRVIPPEYYAHMASICIKQYLNERRAAQAIEDYAIRKKRFGHTWNLSSIK